MKPSKQLFACFFARAPFTPGAPIHKDDVALQFGATRPTLDNWVAGRVKVPIQVVMALCKVAGMSPGVWIMALAAQHGAEDGIGRAAFPALWADIERLGGLPPIDPTEPAAVFAGGFVAVDGEIISRDPRALRDDSVVGESPFVRIADPYASGMSVDEARADCERRRLAKLEGDSPGLSSGEPTSGS